jgi:hypothetical protein
MTVPIHDEEAVVTADQPLAGVVLVLRCDDVVPR